MAFKSYPLPYAYLLWNWSSISFLYTIEKYLYILLVHDKWYSYLWWNLWTIFTLALTLNCLISIAKDLVWSKSSRLPCIFWIFVALLKICFMPSSLGKALIPILCIYIQKSYFLIMHYSWEAILHWVDHHSLNWFCILLLSLNMTSVWIICMESDDLIMCILYSNARS